MTETRGLWKVESTRAFLRKTKSLTLFDVFKNSSVTFFNSIFNTCLPKKSKKLIRKKKNFNLKWVYHTYYYNFLLINQICCITIKWRCRSVIVKKKSDFIASIKMCTMGALLQTCKRVYNKCATKRNKVKFVNGYYSKTIDLHLKSLYCSVWK